jgi:hypothetical protein
MVQVESNPEGTILRFIRSLERASGLDEPPPLLNLNVLAEQLGLERDRCRQALYELTRLGDLGVTIHSQGFFQLWTPP